VPDPKATIEKLLGYELAAFEILECSASFCMIVAFSS